MEFDAVAETHADFDALAQACIDNHKEIVRQGSPEMQTASRMLLYVLSIEIRRRADSTVSFATDEAEDHER